MSALKKRVKYIILIRVNSLFERMSLSLLKPFVVLNMVRLSSARKEVDEEDVVLPLKKVLRIADAKDRLIVEENKQAAKEAYDVCSRKSE